MSLPGSFALRAFRCVGETGEEWATGRSETLPFITKIAQWDSYTAGHMTPLMESVNLGHNLLGAKGLSQAYTAGRQIRTL